MYDHGAACPRADVVYYLFRELAKKYYYHPEWPISCSGFASHLNRCYVNHIRALRMKLRHDAYSRMDLNICLQKRRVGDMASRVSRTCTRLTVEYRRVPVQDDQRGGRKDNSVIIARSFQHIKLALRVSPSCELILCQSLGDQQRDQIFHQSRWGCFIHVIPRYVFSLMSWFSRS